MAQHIRKCQEYEMTGKRNKLTFLSKNFINKALLIIRQILVERIVYDIHRCGEKFGLMMDATQDVTFQEQISLVVRYVDETNKIVERTISFFNAKDTTGLQLYTLLRRKLIEVNLSPRNVIGCSFDGASNMSSDEKGVISHIQRNDNPDCFFAWCLSHRFNLCVTSAVASLKITEILDLTEECAKVFRASYKAMDVWDEIVKKTPGVHSRTRLKLIGTTRWSSKYDAIESIMKSELNFYVLIKALVELCVRDKKQKRNFFNASNSLNSWLLYDNVVISFLLRRVFSILAPTTKFLQTMGLNILDGVKSLRQMKKKLEDLTAEFDFHVEQAEGFVSDVNSLLTNDAELSVLECECYIRLPTEERKQDKINSIKEIIRNFAQTLQQEINTRVLEEFDDSTNLCYEIQLLDPATAIELFASGAHSMKLKQLCKINNITDEKSALKELKTFASEFVQYQKSPKPVSFLNESSGGESSDEELDLLLENESDFEEIRTPEKTGKIQSMHGKKCSCVECILSYIKSNQRRTEEYALVYKMYKYVATLPSTQVKCERDFSKLKLTKTRLRSSLSEQSLENLMIISTESELFKCIKIADIIDRIVALSTRMSLHVGI